MLNSASFFFIPILPGLKELSPHPLSFSTFQYEFGFTLNAFPWYFKVFFSPFQCLLSTPDTVYHSWAHGHEHKHSHGGHHHGIDMEHPILALNMTLISIGVKEGYVAFSFLLLKSLLYQFI